MGINQWGPWLMIASGVAGWSLPIAIWTHSIVLDRRIARNFSRMSPPYRDFVKREIGEKRLSHFSIIRMVGWKLPALATTEIITGVAWLFFRSAG